MNPSMLYRYDDPYDARSRNNVAWTSIGRSLVTRTSRAITAFVIEPSRTASRAATTAAR